MPKARAVKRSASNASGSAPAKIKKKPVHLPIPTRKNLKCRLLTCGSGDVGQLGLGDSVMECSRFKYVAALGDRVVDACAGGMHTVALDADGKVWTFGCNDEGALGRITEDGEEFTPGLVKLPAPAVAICAGDSHSAALLESGDVYIWGAFRDSHGSMGLLVDGKEGKACKEPVRLTAPAPASITPAAAIASGGDHLALLTANGALYTVGCGEQGQLGRLSERSASRHARHGLSALLVPQQVCLKGMAKRVWAGSHATVCQVSKSDTEKILVTGLNNYTQLGVAAPKNKEMKALYSPVESEAFNAVGAEWSAIACGAHHTLSIDDSGCCYALGRHEYGRLGLGSGTEDATTVTVIPKLANKKCVSVAATTCSSFAVADTGEAYAWGMGSEGQLGMGGDEDKAEPTVIQGKALEGHRAVLVAAGGQHTVLLVTDINARPSPEPVLAKKQEEPQKLEVKVVKEEKTKKKSAKEERIEEVSSTSDVMEVEESSKDTKEIKPDDVPTPMEINEPDNVEDIAAETRTNQKTTDSTHLAPETEKQPLTSETEKQPLTSETAKQPLTSETDKLPSTSETEKQPSTLESAKQPSTSETEKQLTKPEGPKTDEKIETDIEQSVNNIEENGSVNTTAKTTPLSNGDQNPVAGDTDVEMTNVENVLTNGNGDVLKEAEQPDINTDSDKSVEKLKIVEISNESSIMQSHV